MSLDDYTHSDCGPCPTCGKCRCCSGDGFSFGYPTWQDATSNHIDCNSNLIKGINELVGKVRVDSSAAITKEEIQKVLDEAYDQKSP